MLGKYYASETVTMISESSQHLKHLAEFYQAIAEDLGYRLASPFSFYERHDIFDHGIDYFFTLFL